MRSFEMSFWILGLSLAVQAHAAPLRCENSPTGALVLEGDRLVCQVSYRNLDSAEIQQETLGMVAGFELSLHASFPSSMEALGQVLGRDFIRLSEQTVEFEFLLQGGQRIPALVKASPTLGLALQDTLCQLQFSSIEFNVTSVESPFFPTWVAYGIRDVLNSQAELRALALETINERVQEALNPYCTP